MFGVPPLIGELILALGAVAFVLLAAFYITKILRAPAAVLAELMHPGQSSFFGTISNSFVLLAAAVLPWSGPLADLLWAIGGLPLPNGSSSVRSGCDR
jgi:tellurite resistance protein